MTTLVRPLPQAPPAPAAFIWSSTCGGQRRALPAAGGRLVGGDVKLFLNGRVARGLGDRTVALTGLALALLPVRLLYRRRISPKDLAATLYHVLGINPFQDYHDRQGRTFKVLDEGEVIRELVS